MTDLDLKPIIQRFATADCSWLTTIYPDSRPHSAPIWHVWTGGRIYIVTTPTAVKVRNIRHNSAVTITHPDPHSAIIIEGRAQFADHLAGQLRILFEAKYDWDIVADEDYRTIIEIIPEKILAWGEEGAGHRRRWRGEEVMAAGE